MPDEFSYDVFLSHSAKDKPLVSDVAERVKMPCLFLTLRRDGGMTGGFY